MHSTFVKKNIELEVHSTLLKDTNVRLSSATRMNMGSPPGATTSGARNELAVVATGVQRNLNMAITWMMSVNVVLITILIHPFGDGCRTAGGRSVKQTTELSKPLIYDIQCNYGKN